MTQSNIQFFCFFIAALMLAGCSASPPQTLASENETQQETQIALRASASIDKTPSVPEKDMIPALSDENNIYFTEGGTTIDEAGKDKLRRLANHMKQNPKKKLTLATRADDTGSRTYSLAIAEERLVAVGKLLRSYGVSSRQIRRNRIDSAKKSRLCNSMACQQQMHRVELVYQP